MLGPSLRERLELNICRIPAELFEMASYCFHGMQRERERPPARPIVIRYPLFADSRELSIVDIEIHLIDGNVFVERNLRHDYRQLFTMHINARPLDERVVQFA